MSSAQPQTVVAVAPVGGHSRPTAAAAIAPRSKGFVSLNIVVALITGFVVILVASVTFSITYTQSLTTVEDIGKRFAKAQLATARVRTEDLFGRPTQMALALQQSMLIPGMMLPADDPTVFGVLQRTLDRVLQAQLEIGLDMPTFSINFNDGSQAATRFHNESVLVVHQSNGATLSNVTRCCATVDVRDYYYPTMARTPVPVTDPTRSQIDPRTSVWLAASDLLSLMSTGFWSPPLLYAEIGDPFFVIPAGLPVRNASGVNLGAIFVSVRISSAAAFLRTLSLTKGSHMFILDDNGVIAATTHPTNFTVFSSSTDPLYVPDAEKCISSSFFASEYVITPGQVFQIACRDRASEFPYPALNAAASVRSLMRPSSTEVFYDGKLEADGKKYYAAAAMIPNRLQTFPLSLLLIVPEKDVLGDIEKARDTVLGIVSAVLVVAVIFAALLIVAVMRPLDDVSRKMQYTARLSSTIDDGDTSLLTEVAALQSSYRRMDTAIKSFTKYVPRDVIKGLMRAGRLGAIEMEKTNCTMLFVDIAGFTTLCENVPPDDLSRLVTCYFERMSTVVMTHGGLIDKYIGDCIMAIWGAPYDIDNKAIRATLCALQIDRETRVDPIASAFDEAGEQISVRVGVASGEVLAGNMGSTQRMNYTVIGDPVNLAARIEGLNKAFGTRVAICGDTASQCGSLFCLRLLMKVAVVGKLTGVPIFEVVGLDPATIDQELVDLRNNDNGPLRRTDSDLMSNASEMSSRSRDSHLVQRDDIESVTKLVDAGRRLANPSIVASDDEKAFATAFTSAVRYYIAGDFAAVTSALATLTSAGDTKAVLLLRRLVQEAIERPTASGEWTGVWHADAK